MLNLFVALAMVAAPAPKPATNAVCPVLGSKVDTRSPKVVVRGQEYRVCCLGCDSQLKATPDKYLKADGTPRNAQ
jgi:YHS domain-containing protein